MVDPSARAARTPGGTDTPSGYENTLRPLALAFGRRRGDARRFGGKATSLGRLVREGLPVPRGWVLPADHFDALAETTLPRGHDLPTLIKLAGSRTGIDRAARARDRIQAAPLAAPLQAAIEALWADVGESAPWGLAVRSSATCEDGEETSFAGLATTLLGVRGPEGLAAAIKQVWASAFLPRAIDYLAHHGVRDVAMAVLVQVMARAEAAGVLFTAPPPGLAGEHWGENERLVNVTLGLGAPVVEGAMPTDSVRFAKAGGVVATVVAEKRRALVVGPRGMEEVAIPEDRTRLPALSHEAIGQLGELASRLEQGGTGPFDVEFAVERTPEGKDQVLLLQVRPIGGGGFPEGGDAQTVWSRANVGEALPGAATPLTWSIARSFSEKGFREAFAALGCRVPRGAHLVTNVHGRFYLNLTAFMQIAAQVPLLSPRALLQASGGAGEAAIALLERQTEDVSKRGFLARLPVVAPRVLASQARLERDVASYEVEAERARRSLAEMDLGLLPDDALATTLRTASALLDRTGTLMLSCASASLASHLALARLLDRVAARRSSARDDEDAALAMDPLMPRSLSTGTSLAHALVGGVRELESAGPGVALARIAVRAREEPEARECLLAGKVRALNDLPDGPTRRELESFLDTFGDRAVREAELSTPRWREDPTAVLAMLVAALRAPDSDPDRALARARALADREMAQLETRIGPAVLYAVRALVTRTQRFTRLRERMRMWVTRVLGMLRTIALDVDRRLRRIDPTLPTGAVFFCTYDELILALRSGRAEIGHVARLRRAEHLRDAQRPDPPPTFIGRPPPVQLPPAFGRRLVGLPASSGVVEGRARVLAPGTSGLDAVCAGEILVTRTTDVGLSPLFLVAAAVVTELGGPLSHAAIVAREYGVPAVVNVPGATVAIRTGDRVRVDGDRGTIEIFGDDVRSKDT
ncbi:PEP/pyruvate-binding domain-containing protein [Polyangium jinanense]|uniref:Phosphoenolpyruvate synthase n=1 Tax=Polyangium jinanense TaxID=2829994 RepID=A0A9X4ATT8_9BACT|nr:PEP/pyruvate-binding domain-containing protein [Polyangium jinanense]MDC3952283.1 phosphoenolpyruvate synthase [Polyangium jinanense]MDC3956428.1 phosphoenolpyruvate synthase [Polyangium jinanense]MDC3979912.1 phosphoenolpyruvate synthase [Polyangium jinanense]MDC3982565.1 phosphoenolpyruvate synthase [Polyangium jinanense]